MRCDDITTRRYDVGRSSDRTHLGDSVRSATRTSNKMNDMGNASVELYDAQQL